MSLKHRAHRLLWQRLPRGFRREALLRASAWLAPRPTPRKAAGSGPSTALTVSYPQMHWADANVEEAALALRRLRDDPHYRRQLGDRAARNAAGAWAGSEECRHGRCR